MKPEEAIIKSDPNKAEDYVKALIDIALHPSKDAEVLKQIAMTALDWHEVKYEA